MFFVIHFTHNFPTLTKVLQFTLEFKFDIFLAHCHILFTKDGLFFVSPHDGYVYQPKRAVVTFILIYEGWNFNSDNYLFTTDTK